MRSTFIGMLVVLACSLGLCFYSMHVQFGAIDEMDELRARAEEHLRAGDYEGTESAIVELANVFKGHAKALEMLASHDDLHDAYLHIVDARVSLECRIEDDVLQALVQLGETLAHLREHERFSLTNLY
ncbi:MAG: DUF4363 family protein [Christensenellales bacterium]|jgi:hypothetical protein